ncbi:MAG TPA: DinB family protein [Acidobacteriota bacterium]|nr:DinB family protein [Acidobacteriota bacterium]
MSTYATTRPQPDEHTPYHTMYLSKIPEGDILELLIKHGEDIHHQLSQIAEEQSAFRYAEDKWSLKQVLGHLIDTERIFQYRLLRVARQDQTPIEGFEQDDYVASGEFDARSWASLLEVYTTVRAATVSLIKGLPSDAWLRRGTANKNPVSVRALVCLIAGHELHHMTIVKERYLTQLSQ